LLGSALAVVVIVGAVRLGGRAEAGVAAPADTAGWSQGRLRVEVLNVGGVAGMARAATRDLRSGGFDVVEFRSERPFDAALPSVVIDRVGRIDLAQAVAEKLGIDNVQSDPNPNLYVDVTVVLGSEWSGSGLESDVDEAIGANRWWDPRGWFGR
jgi:hypothetical protein